MGIRNEKVWESLPVTDDIIFDVSWFIESTAYSFGGVHNDYPRRQGFEKDFREFLKRRGLKIVKED